MEFSEVDFYEALKVTLQNYTPKTVGEGYNVLTALSAMCCNIAKSIDDSTEEAPTSPRQEVLLNARSSIMGATAALMVTSAPHDVNVLEGFSRSLPLLVMMKAESLGTLGRPELGVEFIAKFSLQLITMLVATPWLTGLAEHRSDLDTEARTKKSMELADKLKDVLSTWTKDMLNNPENN